MRDFQDCLQFSFKQRYSSIDEADTGHRKRRKKVLLSFSNVVLLLSELAPLLNIICAHPKLRAMCRLWRT